MSIKTHYALAQNGETDKAKFPSVLHSGGPTLQSVGPNCKMFIPCTETAGTDVSDPVGGVTLDFSDPGDSIAFTVPNAITGENGNTPTPSVGAVPIIGTAATILFSVHKTVVASEALLSFGAAGVGDTITVTPVSVSGLTQGFGAFSSPALAAVNIGDTIAAATVFQGDGTFRFWRDGTFTASAELHADAVDFQNSNSLAIGNPVAPPHTYGCCLLQFATMPSDAEITTVLQAMKADWVAGKKRLWAGWVTKS